MKKFIEKKYLTFPVNPLASVKKVKLFDASASDDTPVYVLDCRIDPTEPEFTAFADVSRFKGRTLEVSVSPSVDCEIGEADAIPSVSAEEKYRPLIHFTVKNGWNNDPNGLIRYKDEYHMFYQYNPCDTLWGNMHWGHAVSRDLIRWEELDIALFPDETGAMYSGSAIEDTENRSQLGDGKTPPLLMFYTAASKAYMLSGDKKTTQRLAYSTDGRSFVKYGKKPMVDHIVGENRDPKVVWVEELRRYVMAIYLDGNRYALFVSDNLLDWSPYQELTVPGESECPDLFPLEYEGERLWAFMGASDYYVLGRFGNNGFITVGETKRLTHSSMNYAAQSFSGLDGERAVRIYWQRTQNPCKRASQQMSIPVEMSLTQDNGEYYIQALPVCELDALRDGCFSYAGQAIRNELTAVTKLSPLDIILSAPYDRENRININFYGTTVCIDMRNGTLSCGRDRLPLSLKKDRLEVRMIIDRCTAEIFTDNGRYNMACRLICDKSVPRVTLSADRPFTAEKLDFYPLKPII